MYNVLHVVLNLSNCTKIQLFVEYGSIMIAGEMIELVSQTRALFFDGKILNCANCLWGLFYTSGGKGYL